MLLLILNVCVTIREHRIFHNVVVLHYRFTMYTHNRESIRKMILRLEFYINTAMNEHVRVLGVKQNFF